MTPGPADGRELAIFTPEQDRGESAEAHEARVAAAQAEARRYDFFQLVGLLLRLREGALPPGGEGPARQETVRFRPSLHLGFSPGDLDEVDRYEAVGEEIPVRYRVSVNFMGLYGPSSPLPNHFTEELMWSGTDGDTQRAFLDLFHHRLISFVYRAWAKYRHWIQFESKGADRTTQRLFSLIGLGTPGMLQALDLSGLDLLRTAGLLGGGPRSAAGLEGLLRDHFPGVPLRVRSFVPREVAIGPESLTRLGGARAVLGREAVLGEWVHDLAGGFRVEIGPLDVGEYRSFLPKGERCDRLCRLVRFYLQDPLVFDLKLRLSPSGMTPLRLGGTGDPRPLGQMSWMMPSGREEGDVVLPVERHDPLLRSGRAA